MTTGRKILIVDDDPRGRKLLEALLRAGGHETRSADSGATALEAIDRLCPDLVLLDLMMPDMDGFDVVRRLRRDPATSGIPIILVTALDDEASRARVRASGVADFVTKPIDRWALKACIDKWLGEDHDRH